MSSVILDALLGLATGDAFGVPVEFLDREIVRRIGLKDMVGKDTPGIFESRWSGIIPAGAWSDDTSMAVASMVSIINNEGKIDFEDQMKQFMNWWENNQYTSLSFAFGLGNNIANAMYRYKHGTAAVECGGIGYMDNGNGCLMRMLPFSLYSIFNKYDQDDTANLINKASALTHANDISKMSCFIYTEFLRTIIENGDKEAAFKHITELDYSKYYSKQAVEELHQVVSPLFKEIKDTDIKESGYVVETLKGALYSILNGTNFEDSVVTAINLGYDTDTTGAITGSIAGALYGKTSIPERWLSVLRKKELLETVAERFEAVLHTI